MGYEEKIHPDHSRVSKDSRCRQHGASLQHVTLAIIMAVCSSETLQLLDCFVQLKRNIYLTFPFVGGSWMYMLLMFSKITYFVVDKNVNSSASEL